MFVGKGRKIAVLLILALILSLALVGCGNDKNANGKSAENKKTEEPKVTYPVKQLTVVVPFGAGGGTDQVARMLAGIMEPDFGQPIVCVNKTGGAGAVGYTETANAKPDGYNIVLSTSNISTIKATGNSQLTYKDFEPIIAVNFDSPALMVRSDSPFSSAKELLDYAKENPKKINIGTGSPGGLWHVGVIKLEKEADVKFNIVPSTTGGAKASVSLLGGHVDAIAIPPNEAIAQLKSGEFKMLAIMTSERVKAFPDVPTFKELGYDVEIISLRGYLAPKGTPAEIVKILHDKIKKAMDNEKYIDYMDKQVSNIIYMDSAKYKQYLEKEFINYTKLIEEAGLAKGSK
jgi:tripartite-type tricarboxylate transporter receptor subunit TctC